MKALEEVSNVHKQEFVPRPTRVSAGEYLVESIWPSFEKKLYTNKGQIIDLKNNPTEVWPSMQDYNRFKDERRRTGQCFEFQRLMDRIRCRTQGIRVAMRKRTKLKLTHTVRYTYIGDGKVVMWWHLAKAAQVLRAKRQQRAYKRQKAKKEALKEEAKRNG